VVEGYSAVLTERVRGGEFAFAIVPAFQGGAGLNARLFQSTPEVLVSRRGSGLKHLAPVRLPDLGPLKLVLPGYENTRRRTIETHLMSNGAQVRAMLELDAMLGTLDLVASTDWVTILPGVMMAAGTDPDLFAVNPIVDPVLALDLVLIESMRQPMDSVAQAFLRLIENETARVNARWAPFMGAAASAPRAKAVSRTTA